MGTLELLNRLRIECTSDFGRRFEIKFSHLFLFAIIVVERKSIRLVSEQLIFLRIERKLTELIQKHLLEPFSNMNGSIYGRPKQFELIFDEILNSNFPID